MLLQILAILVQLVITSLHLGLYIVIRVKVDFIQNQVVVLHATSVCLDIHVLEAHFPRQYHVPSVSIVRILPYRLLHVILELIEIQLLDIHPLIVPHVLLIEQPMIQELIPFHSAFVSLVIIYQHRMVKRVWNVCLD